MLFPTFAFAAFFAVVYPLSWLLRWRSTPWKLFILGASYFFYSAWDWRFVGLIALSTLVNAALGPRVAEQARSGRREALVGAIAFNLGLLGIFKYYGFFIDSLNTLLRTLGLPGRLPVLEIIVPVGISFFTFMAISYIVDLHRRQIQPVGLLDFAVFLAFFPHLVAGPIVRASEFLPQLPRPRLLSQAELGRALLLIGGGLFKKLVISTYLATAIADPVFAEPARRSALEILVGVYAYAVQIYADFSGYTDMAIGIALLLGIQFPQNFDRPYSAASLREFWRRWHMTLSRWLRDYLYIPLGGSRGGTAATYRNLLLTMTLAGLWHGAAWTFVIWGLLLGLGMIVERWLGERRRPAAERRDGLAGYSLNSQAGPGPAAAPVPIAWNPWLGRLVTFHVVCLGWVFFRAESVGDALQLLARALTAWGPAPLVTGGVLLVTLGSLALQLVPADIGHRLEVGFGRLPLPAQAVAFGLLLAAAIVLGPSGVAPFIYYQF